MILLDRNRILILLQLQGIGSVPIGTAIAMEHHNKTKLYNHPPPPPPPQKKKKKKKQQQTNQKPKKQNTHTHTHTNLIARQCEHYKNMPIQIYWKFYHQKQWKFSYKNSDMFHISAQNIDCGYSLKPPRRGGSNEYQ